MENITVTAGKTNVSVYFYIVGDASHASTGDPLTGFTFSSVESGGSASYARQGAARVDLTAITLGSTDAAHSDGGFIEMDATNMPGLYRMDYPDAAFVTGVDQVILQIVINSSLNALAQPIYVDLTDVDLRDSVRGGMTAIPNAAADAAGGLPISDAGGLDMDAIPSAITTVDTVVDAILEDTGTTLPATLGSPAGASVSADIAALPTAASILTTQLTESYAADGTEPTLAQALMLIQQVLTELSLSSTTGTVKKLDGSTTAATLTYDDAANPTSYTRAS